MLSLSPLVILAIGIFVVLGMIIVLRINAFVALITAAMVVSLLAPGPVAERISRVAVAFGVATGQIGVVIALAAVIGKCMMDSGAADRVVRFFLRLFGERRASIALMGSGYVLSVPVFFDTVFYLLIPLARSLWKTTRTNYLKYVLAIAAGGAVTHTLVPPTPGPLAMAASLNVDVGMMMLVGGLVALPCAVAGLIFGHLADAKMNIPMRQLSSAPDPEPLRDDELPSLLASVLPVILPVLLISSKTIVGALSGGSVAASMGEASWQRLVEITAILGDANLALLVAMAIALVVLSRQRRLSRSQLAETVEVALMSGGVVILITAAGGAFGAMLREAKVGDAIQGLFGQREMTGLALLGLGFLIAAILKVAQGSSTVAMITTAPMMAALVPSPELLGFHPVYLATAIGSGSLIGSWMNDSGFWIVAKMSGLTEVETLKSWTVLLVVLGVTGLATTLLLATVMPLTG